MTAVAQWGEVTGPRTKQEPLGLLQPSYYYLVPAHMPYLRRSVDSVSYTSLCDRIRTPSMETTQQGHVNHQSPALPGLVPLSSSLCMWSPTCPLHPSPVPYSAEGSPGLTLPEKSLLEVRKLGSRSSFSPYSLCISKVISLL